MIPFNYRPLGDIVMAKDEIVDYGGNSAQWYRKWKSGFIEQGGVVVLESPSSGPYAAVNLLQNFSDTNYIVVSNIFVPQENKGYSEEAICVPNKRINSFTLSLWSTPKEHSYQASWYACGY